MIRIATQSEHFIDRLDQMIIEQYSQMPSFDFKGKETSFDLSSPGSFINKGLGDAAPQPRQPKGAEPRSNAPVNLEKRRTRKQPIDARSMQNRPEARNPVSVAPKGKLAKVKAGAKATLKGWNEHGAGQGIRPPDARALTGVKKKPKPAAKSESTPQPQAQQRPAPEDQNDVTNPNSPHYDVYQDDRFTHLDDKQFFKEHKVNRSTIARKYHGWRQRSRMQAHKQSQRVLANTHNNRQSNTRSVRDSFRRGGLIGRMANTYVQTNQRNFYRDHNNRHANFIGEHNTRNDEFEREMLDRQMGTFFKGDPALTGAAPPQQKPKGQPQQQPQSPSGGDSDLADQLRKAGHPEGFIKLQTEGQKPKVHSQEDEIRYAEEEAKRQGVERPFTPPVRPKRPRPSDERLRRMQDPAVDPSYYKDPPPNWDGRQKNRGVTGIFDRRLGYDPELSQHDDTHEFILPDDASHMVRSAQDIMTDLQKMDGDHPLSQIKKTELAQIGRHLKGHGYPAHIGDDHVKRGHPKEIPHNMAGVEQAVKRPEHIGHFTKWQELAKGKAEGNFGPHEHAQMNNLDKYFKSQGIDIRARTEDHKSKSLDRNIRTGLRDYGHHYRDYMKHQASGDPESMQASMDGMKGVHGQFEDNGLNFNELLDEHSGEFKRRNPNFNWTAARAFSEDIKGVYADQKNYPGLESAPHHSDEFKKDVEQLRNRAMDHQEQASPTSSASPAPAAVSKKPLDLDPMRQWQAREAEKNRVKKEFEENAQYDEDAYNRHKGIRDQMDKHLGWLGKQVPHEGEDDSDVWDLTKAPPQPPEGYEDHPDSAMVEATLDHPAAGQSIPTRDKDPGRSAALQHVSKLTQDPVAHAMLMSHYDDASKSFMHRSEQYDGLQSVGGYFSHLGGDNFKRKKKSGEGDIDLNTGKKIHGNVGARDPKSMDREVFFKLLAVGQNSDQDMGWDETAKERAKHFGVPESVYENKTSNDRLFPAFDQTAASFDENPGFQQYLDPGEGELKERVWNTLMGLGTTQEARKADMNPNSKAHGKKLTSAMLEMFGGGGARKGLENVDFVENAGRYDRGELGPTGHEQVEPAEELELAQKAEANDLEGAIHPGRARAQDLQRNKTTQDDLAAASKRLQASKDEDEDAEDVADEAGSFQDEIENHPSFGEEIEVPADPKAAAIQLELGDIFKDNAIFVNEMMEHYDQDDEGTNVPGTLAQMFHDAAVKMGLISDDDDDDPYHLAEQGKQQMVAMAQAEDLKKRSQDAIKDDSDDDDDDDTVPFAASQEYIDRYAANFHSEHCKFAVGV